MAVTAGEARLVLGGHCSRRGVAVSRCMAVEGNVTKVHYCERAVTNELRAQGESDKWNANWNPG